MNTVIPKTLCDDIQNFMDNFDEDCPDTNNFMNIISDDYKLFIRIRLESMCESIVIYLSGNNFVTETDRIFDVEFLPYGHLLDKYKDIEKKVDDIEKDLLDKIVSAIEKYIADTEEIVGSKISFKNPHKNILSTKDEEVIDVKQEEPEKDKLELFEENKRVFNVSVEPKELPESMTKLLKVYDSIQIEFNIHNNFLDLDLPVNLFLEKETNLGGINYIHSYIVRKIDGVNKSKIAQSLKEDYMFDFDFADRSILDIANDKSLKEKLIKMITVSIDSCISYLKKVGDGKITYKIYIYRRMES